MVFVSWGGRPAVVRASTPAHVHGRFRSHSRMHYSPDPALAAGFVPGLGFGVGRETPMLSKTNPKPFFSVSKKLMVPLPFRTSQASLYIRPITTATVPHPFPRFLRKWVGNVQLFMGRIMSPIVARIIAWPPEGQRRRAPPTARRARWQPPPAATAYWRWPAAGLPATSAYR